MALAAFSHPEPILPSEKEAEIAQKTSQALSSLLGKEEMLQLKSVGQEVEITLPASAVRLLLNILTHMSEGNAVTIIPIHAELTTQQAADLLNVSRQFLIDELLEKGVIPFRKVGTHRRILFQDVMRYRQENRAQRLQAIDTMVAHDQQLGLY